MINNKADIPCNVFEKVNNGLFTLNDPLDCFFAAKDCDGKTL